MNLGLPALRQLRSCEGARFGILNRSDVKRGDVLRIKARQLCYILYVLDAESAMVDLVQGQRME